MSNNVKVFKNGIAYEPLSADPSNPVEGQVQYSDGTVRAKGLWQYNGSDWVSIGSGGGGLDVFFTEDFASTGASDFNSGNSSTFEDPCAGTLDGTIADETSSPISTDASLKYTMGSSSTDDFFSYGNISLDTKQKGNTVGVSFYYTYNGDSGDIKFVAYDSTNSEVISSTLDTLDASSTATRFSTSFNIPSDCENIKYGFQVVTGNSGKILVLDDVELSLNPFVYKDLIKTSSVRAAGNGGTSISSGVTDIDFTEVSDSNGAWNGTTYTVQSSDSIIDLDFSCIFTTSSSRAARIFVNGSSYSNLQANAGVTNDYFKEHYTFSKGELNAGDTITIRLSGSGTLSNDTSYHYLTINEQWESEHIVTPAKSTTETYHASGHAGFGSTNTVIPYMSTEVYNSISQLGTVSNDSTNGWSFTASDNVIVTLVYSANSGGGTYNGISLNSSQLTTGIVSITAADRLASDYVNSGEESTSATTIEMNTGDIIRPHGSASAPNRATLTMTVSKKDATFLAAIPVQKVAYLKDVKSSGTNGGASSSNTVHTRDLNTVEGDTSIVSLSGNQFTLQPGKYKLDGSVPGYQADRIQAFIYDVTNGVYIIDGASNYQASGVAGTNYTTVSGTIEITIPTTFELRQWFQTGDVTGLGFAVDVHASNPQSGEVYSVLEITKLR